MKKRLLAILAMTMAVSIGLSGCGTSNSSSNGTSSSAKDNGKVDITFANWNKEDTWTDFIKVINEKVPEANIQFQFIDTKEYDNVINTQLAAGEGPDILAINNQSMIKAGYTLDISNEDFTKLFSDAGLSLYSRDGKAYGLPAYSWFEGIFYNKEIFDKYGLKPPKTWDEYMAIHEALKNNGIKPQTMGAKSWEPLNKSSVGFLLNDFYSTDAGKNFDADFNSGKKTFSGNYNDALKTWSQLITKGYLDKNMLGLDYDQALDEFATGKAAMWESGPWSVDTIKQKNPNLKFGMFPFVGTKPGDGWLVGGSAFGFGINANSKHIDVVKKVLAAIATPEAQNAILKANPGSSSFLKGLTTEMDPMYADCAATFKDGNIATNWEHWPDVNSQAMIQEIGSQYQNYLGGQESLDDALKAMDKKSESLRIK